MDVESIINLNIRIDEYDYETASMDKLEDNPTLENEINELLKFLPNLESLEIHGSENSMLNIDINFCKRNF